MLRRAPALVPKQRAEQRRKQARVADTETARHATPNHLADDEPVRAATADAALALSGVQGSTESEAAQWGDTMKCLFRGREIDSATDPEYLAWYAEIMSKISPYDYEPDFKTPAEIDRASLQAQRVSREYWRFLCTLRAKRRVAQARGRKEAKARRAQFPFHANFDELWASLPKCPAGHYRVLGDEFSSMCTLFWLGDYDTLKEAKRRADGLNSRYNWRGYLLDEHGNRVTL